MVTLVAEGGERDLLLGEIEAEIVAVQYHTAGIRAGEQINVERESNNTHDRRAIRVENGHFEPVDDGGICHLAAFSDGA